MPVSMTYPDGEADTLTYNAQGALNGLKKSDNSFTYVKDLVYDEAGRTTNLSLGLTGSNPILSKAYNYFGWTTADTGGQLSSMTTTNAASQNLQNLSYNYDKNGNITSINNQAGGETSVFGYDSVNRLTNNVVTANTGGAIVFQEAFAYDANTGRMSGKGPTSNSLVSFSYDSSHYDAVSALGSNTYTYDANGNQTQRSLASGTNNLTYDAENHLVGVSATNLPPTATPTATITSSPTITPTASITPSVTATQTATVPTATASETFTPSITPTASDTPTITDTVPPSDTPTITNTPLPSPTATNTLTGSETATSTIDPSLPTTTASQTGIPTDTLVPPLTNTPADTNTPTITFTPSNTATASNTPTATVTRTPSITPTPSNTATSSPTATATGPTPTPTVTIIPTEPTPEPLLSAKYVYDGDGNMVKSVVNSTLGNTTTTYYPGKQYLKEIKGTNEKVQKYYNAGTTTVAVRTIINSTDTLQWTISDQIGSTSLTANADGTWNSEIRYSAFGEFRYTSGVTPTNYRYTGQLDDSYIKLSWYNSRWYDSQLARFVQPDSIIPRAGNAQTYDRFAYVMNNPIRYNDPSGHNYCDYDANGICHEVNDSSDTTIPTTGTSRSDIGYPYLAQYIIYKYSHEPSTSNGENFSSNSSGLNLGSKDTHISSQGVGFILDWEEFNSVPYDDGSGNCTVGFGHNLGDHACTQDDMTNYGNKDPDFYYQLFKNDLGSAEAAVRGAFQTFDQKYYGGINGYTFGKDVSINQSQFDSLVDFAFQEGSGNVQILISKFLISPPGNGHSNPYQNNNQMDYALNVIFSSPGGIEIRRKEEQSMFYSGTYNSTH